MRVYANLSDQNIQESDQITLNPLLRAVFRYLPYAVINDIYPCEFIYTSLIYSWFKDETPLYNFL